MNNETIEINSNLMEQLDTEASALQHIVSWSEKRPMWQRDALRRLCYKDTLDEKDYAALIAIAKGDETTAQPLKYEHVPSPEATYSTVNLKSIHDSENVNALEPKQTLSFEKGNGITIIYGDNGSGKSGYVRILKNACRARMKAKQEIKPNIYNQNPGTPKATLNFSVNDQNQIAKWEQYQETDAQLSAISVFDSNTASVHVDEENNVAYTPFPLELLRRLSIVCQEISQSIKKEITNLTNQTSDSIKNPRCQKDTTVGKIVHSLNARTNKERIIALATLSVEEKNKHEMLKVDLASDPKKMSRKLSTAKLKLENIMAKLRALLEASSLKNFLDIQTKRANFQAKQAASKAAAEDLFEGNDQDKVLPNLGAEAWQSLWNAARLYSEQDAYPKKLFPYTEENSKCVLCQQDLSQKAIYRLNSFEKFVKDKVKQQEDQAQQEYKTALNHLKNQVVSIATVNEDFTTIRDQIGNEELAVSFKQCAIQAKWRIRSFLADKSQRVDTLAKPIPIPEYQNAINVIQKRIHDLTVEENSPERLSMIRQFNELEDRMWLEIIKSDLLTEVDRQTEKEKLKKLLNDTHTKAITDKSTELATYLVTDALRAEFAREVSKLELGSLAVELNYTKSSSGSPLFKISLTRKPNEKKVSAILSEGEFRCIALAAFLAEQATTKSKSTIVFDDPVCSLDHMHREQIADRLAQEGTDRQIIIFTHDLAFLFLLEGKCKECGTNLAYRSISKTSKKIGICLPDLPQRMQDVEKALISLNKDLKNCRVLYEEYEKGDNITSWEEKVNHYQTTLRKLWEKAVENAVSPVLKRLQNKVNIKGLDKLTVITPEDCRLVREGYRRCSNLLHSHGDDLTNTPVANPGKIQNEIDAIQNWILSIKDRQK